MAMNQTFRSLLLLALLSSAFGDTNYSDRHLQATCPYADRMWTRFELSIKVDYLGQICDDAENEEIEAYIQADAVILGASAVPGASFTTVMCGTRPSHTRGMEGSRHLQGAGGAGQGYGGGSCNFCPPEDDDRRALSAFERVMQSIIGVADEPEDAFQNKYAIDYADEIADDLTYVLPTLFECVQDGVDVTVEVVENKKYNHARDCKK